MAYEIVLPSELENLHLVFCVSQLMKYVPDPSHMLEVEAVTIIANLLVEVQPIGIMDHQTKQLRGKFISLVKIFWDRRIDESTWEIEENMKKSCPHLFSSRSNFRG